MCHLRTRLGEGGESQPSVEKRKGIRVPGAGLERSATVPAIARNSCHLQGPLSLVYSQVHTCLHPAKFIKPRQRAKFVSRINVYKTALGSCSISHSDSPRVPPGLVCLLGLLLFPLHLLVALLLNPAFFFWSCWPFVFCVCTDFLKSGLMRITWS